MGRLEVLLVEDSVSDVRLVREALRETVANVNLTVAHDGLAALQHLENSRVGLVRRPNLILLDLDLPFKSGREVLGQLKNSPEFRQIPVLVMTSSSSDEDIRDVYSLYANSFITKPGDLNEYIDAVRAITAFWFLIAKLPPAPARDAVPCMGQEFAISA
jgi:two-component system, chemotaxis family, response regulator Rcp1